MSIDQVKRMKGQSKKTWMDIILKDKDTNNIDKDILLNRNEWGKDNKKLALT